MANIHANLEKITAWAKRRGFIYPSSEIYGGLASVYDYGHYGVALKNNIRDLWWKNFINDKEDVIGIESQILMHPTVWKASGHVDAFSDPLIEDKVSHKRYRADHVIEAWAKKKGQDVNCDSMTLTQMADYIKENKILSPDGNEFTDPKAFNLLFETSLGVIEGEKNTAYLRAETAQGMFVLFNNVINSMRVRIPFGIAQIGKVFRNEITKGKFIFRTLEFEQMEIQYFIRESAWEETFETWRGELENWYWNILGISKEKTKWKPHHPDKMAHYAKKAEDFLYEFDWGFDEVSGLHYRTDFDLKTHAEHSGTKVEYKDPVSGESFVPHDIESTWGLNRNVLMLIYDAYVEEDLGEGNIRTVLKFKPNIAPVQVAVFPLQKDDQLAEKAASLFLQLKKSGLRAEYDNSGNIGKMYRRQDEIGTPWCVVVDYQTLEDGQVTVRDRDTMQQERMLIEEVAGYMWAKI